MKTITGSIVIPMNETEKKELLKETKETIATDLLKKNGTNKTFGVLDLWRMQKRQKTLGSSTKW